METVLILFLLFSMNDPKLRENLTSFLSFYRENRDLIATFMQNMPTMAEVSPSKERKEENSRPQTEAGDNRILEEYLSRLR